MATMGTATSAAPAAPAYNFNRLNRAHQEQQRAAAPQAAPESVTMSPRARIDAAFDRVNGNWQQLSIPENRELTGPERRALNNLNFLRDTARREDGGLSTIRDGKEVHVDGRGALGALRDGHPVSFYESSGDKPVVMHNFGEVADTTRDLRERIAKTQQQATGK